MHYNNVTRIWQRHGWVSLSLRRQEETDLTNIPKIKVERLNQFCNMQIKMQTGIKFLHFPNAGITASTARVQRLLNHLCNKVRTNDLDVCFNLRVETSTPWCQRDNYIKWMVCLTHLRPGIPYKWHQSLRRFTQPHFPSVFTEIYKVLQVLFWPKLAISWLQYINTVCYWCGFVGLCFVMNHDLRDKTDATHMKASWTQRNLLYIFWLSEDKSI